jgi:hypothetical protein
MVDKTDVSCQSARMITEQANDFKEKFETFSKSSELTKRYIANAKDRAFASLVKVDNVIYKQNGYLALGDPRGYAEEVEAISVDHQSCRLGQWYYQGIGNTHFKDSGAYGKIAGPHEQVHRAVFAAVSLRNKNWQSNQAIREQITTHMRVAEDSSNQILHYIDDMMDERARR